MLDCCRTWQKSAFVAAAASPCMLCISTSECMLELARSKYTTHATCNKIQYVCKDQRLAANHSPTLFLWTMFVKMFLILDRWLHHIGLIINFGIPEKIWYWVEAGFNTRMMSQSQSRLIHRDPQELIKIRCCCLLGPRIALLKNY